MTFVELVNKIGLLVEEYLNGIAEQPEKKLSEDGIANNHWVNQFPNSTQKPFSEDTIVTVEGEIIPHPIIWNGFTKIEKIEDWDQGPWVQGRIELAEGLAFKVFILKGDGIYHLNLVTRAAKTEEERAVHPRWPVIEEK